MSRFLCTVPLDVTVYDGTIYVLAVASDRDDVDTMISDDLEAWLDKCGFVIDDDFECERVTVEYMDDMDEPYPEWGFYEIDHVPTTSSKTETVASYPKKIVKMLVRNGVQYLPSALSGDTVTTPPAAAKPTITIKTPTAIKTPPANSTIGKQETRVMKIDALKKLLFREVNNVVLDGMTGKPAIRTDSGLVSITFETSEPVYTEDGSSPKSATRTTTYDLSINPITDMGMEIPAFAMAIPLDRVDVGDIYITANGNASFVTGVSDGKFTVVSPSGTISKITPATNIMFGSKTVLVVKNMAGSLNGGSGGMNPMMMMFLMNGEGGGDAKEMMRMMMMSQMFGGGQGGGGGVNPMMAAAFL